MAFLYEQNTSVPSVLHLVRSADGGVTFEEFRRPFYWSKCSAPVPSIGTSRVACAEKLNCEILAERLPAYSEASSWQTAKWRIAF